MSSAEDMRWGLVSNKLWSHSDIKTHKQTYCCILGGEEQHITGCRAVEQRFSNDFQYGVSTAIMAGPANLQLHLLCGTGAEIPQLLKKNNGQLKNNPKTNPWDHDALCLNLYYCQNRLLEVLSIIMTISKVSAYLTAANYILPMSPFSMCFHLK